MKSNVYSITLGLIEIFVAYLLFSYSPFYINTYLKICIIWFFLSFIFGHYKVSSNLIWTEIKGQFKTLITAFVLQLMLIFHYRSFIIYLVFFDLFMFFFTVALNRTLRIILRNWLGRKTLIIGTNYEAYRVAAVANNNRFALTVVKGFVKWKDEDVYEEILNEENTINTDKLPIYEFDMINEIINERHIDQVIIAIDDGSKEDYDIISRTLFDQVEIIKVLPKINFTMTFNSKIQDFDGELLISTSDSKLGSLAMGVKRIIDILAGIVGCIILVPLTGIVKVMNNRSGDYDPIFFKQERIGINGEPIEIYKYRTMVPNAEKLLEEMMENDPKIREEYLTNKKLKDDPRVTKAGKILRKTSLDEFPQFINVLKGEMSLVGPRPYLYREIDDMDIYYESIIKCKPGITGMWQANGRSDVGFIERCKFDDYYYKNWSISLDMIIIYKTIKSVLYGKGAL